MLKATAILGIAYAKGWLKVNEFDANNQRCPLVTKFSECPPLCVQRISDCPTEVKPESCAPGNYYCGDGKCHPGALRETACAKVESVCACKNEFNDYLPCKVGFGIDIFTQLHAPDQPLIDACSKHLSKTNTSFIMDCEAEIPAAKFSFFNAEFICFYTFVASEFFLLASYYLYKQRENRVQPTKFSSSPSLFNVIDSANVANSAGSEHLRFFGYRQSPFGNFVKNSVVFSSLTWFVILFVLVADYYELFSYFSVMYRKMLFADHDNLSKVFVFFWHICTIWFLVLQYCKPYLNTWFMQSVEIDSASHVLIEKTQPRPIRSQEMGPLVKWAHKIEGLFTDTSVKTSRQLKPLNFTNNGRLYIEFECVRYIYNLKTCSFEPYHLDLGKTNHDLLGKSSGLSNVEAETRLELSGPNEILFQQDSLFEGLIKEFSGIFYLYQIMMLMIWYFYAYYYMGIVLTVIIVGSGISKVLVSNTAQKRVLEMARYSGNVKVLRNQIWIEVETSDLVVGDIIQIQVSNQPLSVDCVIISGDAVVDESSLTGEALPVTKFSIKNDTNEFSKEACKRNCVFAGTTILEIQTDAKGDFVKGMVLSTGGCTEKGKLVRHILYPTPFIFVFTEHLKIVVPLLILWGTIMLLVSVGILQAASIGTWFYGMFGISQVLSPLLPAVLVINQSVAAERLRKKGIVCVDLNRITLAGKVKVFCFDKTGTLTKEGLDFSGAVHADTSTNQIGSFETSFASFSEMMKLAMCTCHTISKVGGKYVGNFVDVEMFKATNSTMGTNTNSIIYMESSEYPLSILKRYEFVHTHAYMTSVSKKVKSNEIFVFMKGSFEKIMNVVGQNNIPDGFEELAQKYSSLGYYVLAVAGRKVEPNFDTQNIEREEIEKGCQIVGLLLFRNELKADTPGVLQQLREGGCRTIMITGDHPNTAIYIGKESGLINYTAYDKDPLIILAEYKNGLIVWRDPQNLKEYTQSDVEKTIYNSRNGGQKVELAISGLAFQKLLDHHWIPQFLNEIRIFARMNPLDKVKCIKLHMAHHITAMCGDGGNDAGALKTAHAGLALCGSGSSVVSHFSSTDISLKSCVELLREARCSLDVSLASYKLLIIYGEILTFSGLMQYFFMIQISQAMWIFIDACTVPLSWALTMALPSSRLISTRPTARLLGFETVSSVVGQIAINVGFLALMVSLMFRQPFYLCNQFDPTFIDLRRWWELADNYEGELFGILTGFQIIHSACAFNIGSKYRFGFWKNRYFLAAYATSFSLLSGLLLLDPNPFGCAFHINCGTERALSNIGYNSLSFEVPKEYFSASGHNVIPHYFRLTIFLLSVLNLLALLAWEGFIVQGPIRKLMKNRYGEQLLVKKEKVNL